jgi:hypothetical protein
MEPDQAAKGKYKGQRILLSMEKAYGYKEIWATVLSRDYLGDKRDPIEFL